jgi:hypothetical protein
MVTFADSEAAADVLAAPAGWLDGAAAGGFGVAGLTGAGRYGAAVAGFATLTTSSAACANPAEALLAAMTMPIKPPLASRCRLTIAMLPLEPQPISVELFRADLRVCQF